MTVGGSWGVKLSADLKIWCFSLGMCYNPFDLRIYKPNTNVTGFVSQNNSKFIYIKPAIEFRVGIMLSFEEIGQFREFGSSKIIDY